MRKLSDKQYYAVLGSIVIMTVIIILYNQQIKAENAIYFPRPLTNDDLLKYSNNDTKAIIIYPIFTQNAYKNGGFYDYFKGICKTCDVIHLDTKVNATYTTGLSGFQYLQQLGYNYITDIDIDKNPDTLKKYDKIILLHNEYMTENEFNAIIGHPNVIYLYPNSAYVKISVDYNSMKQSLAKGHGYDYDEYPHYPIKSGDASSNGFGYITSSKYEYDFNCKNYKWEPRPNGIQPTCWPEFLIKSDRNILQVIKDYPAKTPDLVNIQNKVNITKLPNCDYYGNCK